MVVIASGYAVTVASCLKVMPIRSYIIRLVARWGMIAVLATVFLGFLYVKTVPENASSLLKDPGLLGMKIAIYASLGLLLLYFIWGQIKPLSIKTIFSLVAIIVIFLGIWSGERIREYIRKPYVIADYMYSSQVIANDIPAKGVANEIDKFNQEGMLKTSAFIPDSLRIVTEENKLEAGRLLASIHCSACHTLDKTGLRPLPLMVKRMAFTDEEEAGMFLEILGDYSYMPQFAGDADDNKALSAFLFSIGK
jgi:mono/diheme cytochrome c family protein